MLRFAQDHDSLAVPLAAGSPVWSSAGPLAVNSQSFGLTSGRVSSLAFDPSDATGNHLFVGTTGGGLWGSQNAAASAGGSAVFTPLTDGLGALSAAPQTGLSVGAVTVQPGGTGVILVGLGDPNDALDSYYGAGILRSADGGKTWALISQTVDLEGGLSKRDYSFVGEGFAGFAWSTTNVQIVVAAVSQAYEGTLVNAGLNAFSMEGLYYSQDGGASWHLARIADPNGQDVQGPNDSFALPDGNAATAVVWNPLRRVFVAAVRYHGYYSSPDGVTWTRMADYPNGQPGTGLTAANCPTEPGSVGVAGCPIFRGALAVNPATGDTFAWTVDAFNQDQGIWQDQCVLSGSACTHPTLNFGVQLNSAALEVADGNGSATIENGDYNLTLSAIPGGLGTGQDTLVFAGVNDLWKCSLANGCVWRNTTNATTCAAAKVGEYQHALAWDTGNPLLVFAGNDSGLWRSIDQVDETGSVCSASDAAHWQNMNGTLGSLAEVVSLGQSAATAATLLAGLGANGFAGVVNTPATAGNWNEVLGGQGGAVAVAAASNLNSWYANSGAGVSIFHCISSGLCNAAGFGTVPVIGEKQVGGDGLEMPYPAEFRLDALDPTQLLIGTCRVWRGPASGSGWSATNAISPILDGTGATMCNGNALIRSIAALQLAGGGEAIYVGMAGAQDGGGLVPGHIFSGILNAAGTVPNWTDLAYSPVVNSGLAFNAFGEDVSGLYVDPHDATGATIYATVSGFASTTEPIQTVYRSTDGGTHWTAITANLPNAPANAVVVDTQDANTVYVALDTGVYVTRAVTTCATTLCWAAYGSGLPLAPVTQLLETPTTAATQTLTAGTYGRGIWQIPLATAGVTITTAGISPISLTFAGQTVGTGSAAQTVTFKTTGTTPMTVTSIGFTGAAASDFTETDTCVGVSLAKNVACTVKVTFTPGQTGSRAATLTANANVAGGQLLVPLTGTGLATANVMLLPTSLGFGTQQVGTISAAQTVNVQNVGGSLVTLASITVSAPFTKGTTTCGGSLAAGSACAVNVVFAPTQAGSAAGSLTVVDGVGSQSAVLGGVGIAGPTDTLSTTSLSFAGTVLGQTAAPQTVQITNSGGLPLTGIGTSISGANSTDFTAVTDCGSTLAATSSCGVTVTFRPSAARAETATLTISDALRAQIVTLNGIGLKPPVIAVSPTTVAFGGLQIGMASTARLVTVANSGGSPLASPSFSLSGPGAANFTLGTTTCSTSLAAGATCTGLVTFLPQSSGASTATLTVSSSSPGVAAASIALSGTGLTPPSISVAPATVTLGTVVVGNSSAAFTILIGNTGQVAMTGLSFVVGNATGGVAGDFALSLPTDIPPCLLTGATLNPGASCNVQVTFSPSVVGPETATLTVTGANAIPATATVSLSGTGSPAIVLQANPVAESFPATAVGTASATQSLTISNLGRQAANGLTLSPTGPFSIVPSATTCRAGSKLSAGSFCTVGLSFAPTAAGDQPGQLTASVTNLGIAPLTVPLDGTGVAVGGILPSPTQMTFGSVAVSVTSAAQTLTVTNSGQAPLNGLGIHITGDFALTANGCAGNLAAGSSCTVGVIFQPTAIGSRTGTLTVSSTSPGVAPGVVSLMGNGVTVGSWTATPTLVSFGTVTVGQTGPAQTVTLTNPTATAVPGLQFLVSGDYSLSANSCGLQLASAASCTFMVSFSPSQPGTRIGSVTVNSTSAGNAPVVVGLTGTGTSAAQLVVTPLQLTFGSVLLGTNSTALQLTVSNPGTGTLTGLAFTTAAPFSVGSGSCGPQLAAGGTCGAPVIFTPTFTGSQVGAVTVSSTSLGVAGVPVTVAGIGLAGPSISLSPATVNFTATTVGAMSASQTVTVANPGGVGLNGLTLQVSGPAAGDFPVGANSCTGTLAGGATCSAVVSFKPTVAGGRTAFLTAASSTVGVASVTSSLSGTGLTPASLGASPIQLAFAATLLGQTSATQTVTITNSGGTGIADLRVGTTAGFALDPAKTNCGQALAAGASCIVGVVFTPATVGVATGSVKASSTAQSTSATVAVSGTGALPPGIVTSPAALVQFGTTGVGQPAQPVQVMLTNQGTLSALTGLALSVDSNGAASGFGLSGDQCSGTTLAAGASCVVNITFKPTATGPLTGALVMQANGQTTTTLALGGIGFNFLFKLIGNSSVTVVQGQTAYYTFTITPLGLPAGAETGQVSFQCGTLPANALCVFNPPQLVGLRASGNVTMGIATGAATVAAKQETPAWRSTAVLISGLILLPIALRRRRHWQRLSALILLAGVMSAASSCAGSGGSAGSVGQTHLGGGTPPGTYPVVVTATSGGIVVNSSVSLAVD
jgi:hypothetical protein